MDKFNDDGELSFRKSIFIYLIYSGEEKIIIKEGGAKIDIFK
jgi:hypothetical protein